MPLTYGQLYTLLFKALTHFLSQNIFFSFQVDKIREVLLRVESELSHVISDKEALALKAETFRADVERAGESFLKFVKFFIISY